MLKDAGKSMAQIARGFFWLGLLIAACSYFLAGGAEPRLVMYAFCGLFVFCAALKRERWTEAGYRKRARRGDLRENVILAGTTADTYQMRHSFTAEQVMEMAIVAEIDIETRPINDD